MQSGVHLLMENMKDYDRSFGNLTENDVAAAESAAVAAAEFLSRPSEIRSGSNSSDALAYRADVGAGLNMAPMLVGVLCD
jgi:hypothetical protein